VGGVVQIVYCLEDKNIKSIVRFDKRIKYRDKSGKSRYYSPDFRVEFLDGNIKIVEIKGEISTNVDLKKNAAIKSFGLSYEMLKQKDLHDLGLFVRSEPFIKKWYLNIEKNYKLKFNKNKCTEKILKKIKDWKND